MGGKGRGAALRTSGDRAEDAVTLRQAVDVRRGEVDADARKKIDEQLCTSQFIHLSNSAQTVHY